MSKPIVSVVIPVYNSEKYLKEALDSVLKQDLQEIEVICVDDGSTDNSLTILKEYEKADERIKAFHKENGGQSTARNVGLSKATGEFVYFLDSDDYILPNTLSKLVDLSRTDDLDILMFSASTIYDTKELEAQHKREEDYFIRTTSLDKCISGREMLNEFAGDNKFCVCPPLHFLRTDFLKSNEITFYEGIFHEDELFFAQILTLAKKVKVISDQLYVRRFHDDSTMTMSKTASHFDGLLIAYAEEMSLYFTLQRTNDYRGLLLHAEYLLCLMKLEYQNMSDEEKSKILTDKDAGYKLVYESLFSGGVFDTPILGTIRDIQNSMSFKIGKAITSIPKKFRKGI